MEPLIGQIIMFAGAFAPRGWAICDGQLLQIERNQRLFGLLGTTYGGDGKTTFALPDLRDQSPNTASHPAAAMGKVPSGDVSRADGHARLRVNFIIALDGVYPSRH